MFPLPGVDPEHHWSSMDVVYESLCGGDQYWLGRYDDDAHTFTPNPDYLNASYNPRNLYDYGVGRASKSFWDTKTQRRLMWSWINDEGRPKTWTDANGKSHQYTWDSMQSVARVISLDRSFSAPGRPRGILRITPVTELSLLRKQPASGSVRGHKLTPGASITLASALSTQLDIVVNLTFSDAHRLPEVSVVLMHGNGGAETAVSTSAPDVPTNYSIMLNTNIVAGDNSKEDFHLKSKPASDAAAAAACIAGCRSYSDCVAWTYVRPAPKWPQGRCALKGKEHKNWAYDAQTISGYMPGFEPSAPLPTPTSSAGTLVLDRSKTGGSGSHQPGSMALRVEDGDGGNNDGVYNVGVGDGDSAKQITLRILYDHSVLEVYDGTSVMSHRVYPNLPMDPVSVVLRAGGAVASSVDADVYEMNNAVNFDGPAH